MRTSPAQVEKPELLINAQIDTSCILSNCEYELLIIDSKSLRQAAIMRLLETWADAMGLAVKTLVPDAQIDTSCILSNCELIIISIDSDASIKDAQHQALIERMRRLVPQAPLVIISDREDLSEVCAAFQGGAVGFMPTSIEPAKAFRALSFIRSGGSFFPLSVLSSRLREGTVNRLAPNSSLTAKQEQVFDLLRQGHSNKAIARQLGMSDATVKVHARRIMHKFRVTNRTQLAVAAVNQSYLRVAENGKEPGEDADYHSTQGL
jgi:DNA-binding NarL/FixJ family response regulator